MPTWPASLPQKPLPDGYQEDEPAVLLRTQMDAGPPKVRQRFTAGVQPFQTTFDMTGSQIETLKQFFRTTIKYGSLPFDWTHPRTGAPAVFRIVQPPSYRNVGGDVWRVTIAMEILP